MSSATLSAHTRRVIERAKNYTLEGMKERAKFRVRDVPFPRPSKWIWKRGDQVMWVGKDSKMQDRQLIGRILSINHRKGSAMVEGLNEKVSTSYRELEDGKQEAVDVNLLQPIPVVELALLDPKDGKPTQVYFAEGGQRFSQRTGHLIPDKSKEYAKMVPKPTDALTRFDTTALDALRVTWNIAEADPWAYPYPRELRL